MPVNRSYHAVILGKILKKYEYSNTLTFILDSYHFAFSHFPL